MKSSRKTIAYLMALAIAATAASTTLAVSAEGEDATTTTGGDTTTTTVAPTDTTTEPTDTTTAPPTDTTTTPTTTVAPVDVPATEDGIVFAIRGDKAYITDVYASKTEIYINAKINNVPIVGVDKGAFDNAEKLKTINVSKSNANLRVVDGALYAYTVKVEKKDGKDVDVYTDTLIAVPAGLASFQLSKDCTSFYWADGDKEGASFANDKVAGTVAANHPTFKAISGKLYFYTTEPKMVEKNGVWTATDEVKIGKLANDKIKWNQGATTTTKLGVTVTNPDGTIASTGDAPQTGVAGVGVAIATLLAAGATAVVLRKRTR